MWLSCDALTLTRFDTPIFSDLSFTMLAGCGIALCGKNGAGKSSLLRILAGMATASSGTMMHDEAARVVLIDHRLGIKSHFTVAEQLGHASCFSGTELLIAPALHYFRLMEHADVPCGILSLGLQKRVALAQLMLINAPIWLLDEPEAHLDHDAIQRLLHLVKMRIAEGGIVLWATHHPTIQASFPTITLEDFHV
jgi:heme exporter protein A